MFMKGNYRHFDISKPSFSGLLITLAIVYGHLGTSPVYTMKTILSWGSSNVSELLIYGSLSCIFWTLTLQTTIKYVIITIRADNKGEGGIFALFALIKRKSSLAAILTMIGGVALLADGVLTPSITVTSSIEGLKLISPAIPVVPIALIIITALFFIQHFGTDYVRNSFGPIMFIWFLILALLGFSQVIYHPEILRALNPVYAIRFLTRYHGGFFILAAVFLCTTGAETIYSNLGNCGRRDIRVSWIFVKTALLLNYFGQGAWMIEHNYPAERLNPFFSMMPEWFLIPGILISVLAAVIAGQAIITGSFTLANEAISLNFWPKLRILHPTGVKEQAYIPNLNWFLWIMCSLVIIFFRESSNIAPAYGLAVTIAMIVTTLLLSYTIFQKVVNRWLAVMIMFFFLITEGCFLISNLYHFRSGGWFTLILTAACFLITLGWYFGRKIKNRYISFSNLAGYLPVINDLSKDKSVPIIATNLVYIIKADRKDQVESKVIYSIFQKQPKRAETYWLLHVDMVNDPNRFEYEVNQIIPGVFIRVDFHLGFKVEPRINHYFKEVLEDMVSQNEIKLKSSYDSLKKHDLPADFKFILLDRIMIRDYKLNQWENLILTLNGLANHLSISGIKALQLDSTNTVIEQVPIIIDQTVPKRIKRI